MSASADRPFRSVLYMPATNTRALAKAATLASDAVIVDLEDAVAPDEKAAARKNLKGWFETRAAKPAATIIRINAPSTEWGADDLVLARSLEPDGILLPKVDTPRDILEAGDALDDEAVPETVKLWAMIETPKAMLNLGAIAELGRDPGSRLAGLVAGTNDLAKDTGVLMTPDRRYLLPWLMQIVLAARAGGLVALDGVMNEFRDLDAFGRECAEGAAMGFDGKTLIHPAQIEPANKAFSPSQTDVAEARAIVDAFARPENAGKGVISLDGRMVERLHLAQAERLLGRATWA
ncbi:HpcH/HpaI aldolase/citrate lyase family protein [Mesorhizobium sp. IMUNJ 23232]|uniref:HpcH/HpaI aldolase/citrate lyase family protein n=1 Tax=Mesorhizobium sp. IMUNJ 23232 TaxID=3376064 RepID=UPI003790B85F